MVVGADQCRHIPDPDLIRCMQLSLVIYLAVVAIVVYFPLNNKVFKEILTSFDG